VTPPRRGRWLIAGGLVGLALSPEARRLGTGLRARATRLGRSAGDPVAPFLEAPCHAHDRAVAAGEARRTAAR
jgi:hypothetical protein